MYYSDFFYENQEHVLANHLYCISPFKYHVPGYILNLTIQALLVGKIIISGYQLLLYFIKNMTMIYWYVAYFFFFLNIKSSFLYKYLILNPFSVQINLSHICYYNFKYSF